MTVARERGSGDFLMGTELHHEKMKSLEIDDGGGGTTMWVYLVTLNCTFKMLFYVICVLPQFLKIEIDNYLFLEEREWAYIELLGSFLWLHNNCICGPCDSKC